MKMSAHNTDFEYKGSWRIETENVALFVETRWFYVGDMKQAVAIRYPSWPGAEKHVRNTSYVPTLGLGGVE